MGTKLNAEKTEKLFNALNSWLNQRPNLDYRDYGCSKSYNSEYRSILNDLHDARGLLNYCEHMELGQLLNDRLENSSDRLTLTWSDDRPVLDYTVGQYWPTEYRVAVAYACKSVIWAYWREENIDVKNKAKQVFRKRIVRDYFN